jgi:hypothetical protein
MMTEPWPKTIPDPADPSGLASIPMPDEMARADQYVPSRAELDNEAYLVSRGVRPLALAGHCPAEPLVMRRVKTLLHRARQAELVIPFIVADGGNPGSAAFGYASHRWCIDLLEWALGDGVPAVRKHEILGLLLGYSPPAIARHQERDGLWAYREEGGRDE